MLRKKPVQTVSRWTEPVKCTDPPLNSCVCVGAYRSVLCSPAVCSLVRGSLLWRRPVVALCGQSHRFRKLTGLFLCSRMSNTLAFGAAKSHTSSWRHLSRCALTANDLELPCVATKQIVVEATTFHVQQQLELSRTGLKDTHFVQNIQLEVHTVVELPLLNFR